MGAGTLINSFVTMHVDAELGDFVCVDNHSTVAHHVILSDGVNFSPGVRAMGSVKCGETTFVGAGAILVPPRIEIGARTVVGAGAVVTRDAFRMMLPLSVIPQKLFIVFLKYYMGSKNRKN